MDRIKNRLNNETSKKSVNTDTYLNVNLEGKERLLLTDEINKIVNVGDRFNSERQKSKFYRILGSINPTITNALFNLDDSKNFNNWKGFNNLIFLDTSYPKDNNVNDLSDLNYLESIKNNLQEQDGWFGYIEPDKNKPSLCKFYDMEPTRKRFSFIPDIIPFNGKLGDTPVKNWEMTITYPHHVDSGHTMVNNGLLIISVTPVIVATKTMTAFGVSCYHNLTAGDSVKIIGTNGYNGTYTVARLGLDNGDYKDYFFVIDLPPNGVITQNSRMKRIVSGKESDYYFRVFKKIKTRNKPMIEKEDCDTYKLGFSENIYNDDIVQFSINDDIDVTDLVDNLGRPLSELYLTKTKTSSNGLFTSVSSGIETPYLSELKTSINNTYLQNIPAINLIHNGGQLPFPSHTPLEINISINNNYFYGDLVEYNTHEVKETILAEVSHRFNTMSRETNTNFSYYSSVGAIPKLTNINLGPRQEGYHYRAHSMIKIREFSSYIEQGDSSIIGMPNYAVDLGDGRYLWRDLLDIGYNQSDEKPLDYPFLNGCHYMYTNDCFLVRRQDAFDNWGLYYNKPPSDPLGERLTDKYTFNSEDEVC